MPTLSAGRKRKLGLGINNQPITTNRKENAMYTNKTESELFDRSFFTIKEVKQANKDLGHHWFSPDTIRFFNCRVLPTVYGGHYFITSEKYDYNSPRLYTIRFVSSDGSIDTVGDFQYYETAGQAKKAIKEASKLYTNQIQILEHLEKVSKEAI